MWFLKNAKDTKLFKQSLKYENCSCISRFSAFDWVRMWKAKNQFIISKSVLIKFYMFLDQNDRQ